MKFEINHAIIAVLNVMMNKLLALIILLTLHSSIYAADFEFTDLSRSQQNALMDLRQEIKQIRDLEKREVVSAELATATIQYQLYKFQAEDLNGLSLSNIQNLLANCQQNTECKRRSIISDLQGFFTFVNIMWFIGIALLLLGLGTLLYLYRRFFIRILAPFNRIWRLILSSLPVIWRWFVSVPVSLYEALLLLIAIGLMFNQFGGDTARAYIGLTGCLIFLASIILFIHLHQVKLKKVEEFLMQKRVQPPALISGAVALVWSVVALYQQSQLVGIFAVMAIMSTLGFTIVVGRLCYFMGFEHYRQIPRTVFSAFVLVVLFSFAHLGSINIGYLEVFETGVFYVATPIYFIGLLIISSNYFYQKIDRIYVLLQVVTIASGIGVLYAGSVYDLSVLRGFGGTLFFIYLIEKYAELPWNRKRLAWPIFLLGALLFSMAYLINEFPEYFFMA